MIQAKASGDNITSNSTEAFSLFEKSSFGEKKSGKIEYSFVESLYLIEHNKMKVLSGSKQLNLDSLIKKLKKIDKRIESKYLVYKDLRKKGYVLKTALKFGADFRVYSKGSHPGKSHAPWLLFITKDSSQLSWNEFAAKNRIAHSTNKRLLLAVIDEESSVSYYEVSWMRP